MQARTYIKCRLCNRQLPRSKNNKYNRCMNEIIGQRGVGRNMDEGDEETI